MRTCWTKRRRLAMWQWTASTRGARAPPRGSTPWSPTTPASLSSPTREVWWDRQHPLASKHGRTHHSQVTHKHCQPFIIYSLFPLFRFSLWHWAESMVIGEGFLAALQYCIRARFLSFSLTLNIKDCSSWYFTFRFSLWHWAKHPSNQRGPDGPIDQALWQKVITELQLYLINVKALTNQQSDCIEKVKVFDQA